MVTENNFFAFIVLISISKQVAGKVFFRCIYHKLRVKLTGLAHCFNIRNGCASRDRPRGFYLYSNCFQSQRCFTSNSVTFINGMEDFY